MSVTPYRAAISAQADWTTAAAELAVGLGQDGTGLGVLYISEHFTDRLDDITVSLAEHTGVTDWIGAVGYGAIGGGAEHYGEPSASALILDLPEEGYRMFAGGVDVAAQVAGGHREWINRATMPLILTHVDPTEQIAVSGTYDLAGETGGFLIGGLTAASQSHTHAAGGAHGGLSGAMISPEMVEMVTAHSQGCSLIGTPHRVTAAQDNILMVLDGRPALDVFKEDIGELLARDLRRISGYIFAALPVEGSDQGDYTVRNLLGIDPDSGAVAIAAEVAEGDTIMFCRRDPASAAEDMERMLEGLKKRVGDKPIKGGIYVSCAARGPNQFASTDREVDMISRSLGDFPMTGFFANGELSRDRIYAYTGVLTLFL